VPHHDEREHMMEHRLRLVVCSGEARAVIPFRFLRAIGPVLKWNFGRIEA
jgi:hypothetical protein